jgi:oligopeptidase B
VKIQDFQLFENHIAVYERENGLPKATVYRLPATGEAVGQLQGGRAIDFADPAYAVEPETSLFHSNIIRFHYSSMRTPPSVFDYDMDTGVSVLKKIDTVSYHMHHLVFVYPIFISTNAMEQSVHLL